MGVTVNPLVIVAVVPVARKEPAAPTFAASAVKTPVPVVVVAGAAPAPPPITRAFAASAADDAQVEAPLKYGMPPLVPATVKASVPVVVTGLPLTEIRPPVNVCPTLVTVPVPETVVHDGFAAAPPD